MLAPVAGFVKLARGRRRAWTAGNDQYPVNFNPIERIMWDWRCDRGVSAGGDWILADWASWFQLGCFTHPRAQRAPASLAGRKDFHRLRRAALLASFARTQ